MTNKTNKIKSEQLGMSFGAACNKLRKSIMFHLLKKLEENICFRCNKKIEIADDLSIDHKKDWLHNNVDLFWDLDNIAFSHSSCNFRHKRPNLSTKIISKDKNKEWCSGCKKFVDIKMFGSMKKRHKNSTRTVRYYCNSCRKIKEK